MKSVLKTVARCEKCGRGFVTVGKVKADPFYPANKRLKTSDMPWKEPCGGRIVEVEA